MNLKTSNILFLVLLAGLWSSCGEKKYKPVSGVEVPVVEEKMTKGTTAMMEKVIGTQVPFTWFAANGQGRFDLDGQRLSARINVRIQRDSIIWVQLQKFGFEVGRMLITRDSAFFINRFERTYSIYTTQDFLVEYNVPADFEMFSKVFTAGAYLPPMLKSLDVGKDGSVNMHSATGMNASHWFDSSWRLVRSEVSDPLAREWLTAYADYRDTNRGQVFPYKRSNTLIIDGIANVFDLQYNDLEIDIPQEFPFSIPSHYEKI
jgi:hypothetical protein